MNADFLISGGRGPYRGRDRGGLHRGDHDRGPGPGHGRDPGDDDDLCTIRDEGRYRGGRGPRPGGRGARLLRAHAPVDGPTHDGAPSHGPGHDREPNRGRDPDSDYSWGRDIDYSDYCLPTLRLRTTLRSRN